MWKRIKKAFTTKTFIPMRIRRDTCAHWIVRDNSPHVWLLLQWMNRLHLSSVAITGILVNTSAYICNITRILSFHRVARFRVTFNSKCVKAKRRTDWCRWGCSSRWRRIECAPCLRSLTGVCLSWVAVCSEQMASWLVSRAFHLFEQTESRVEVDAPF